MNRLFATACFVAGLALAAFSAVSLWPGSAEATMYNIPVTLTEAAALSTCDPNPSPTGGGGSGMVTYDDATNILSWNISFQNLSGPAIAAHFHGPATPAEDAGIQVTIGDLDSPSVGSATITETQEAQLLAGHWYANYHTSACPSGEVRGQVSGGGVGGVTELTGAEGAPLDFQAESDSNSRLIAGVAAAIAAGALIASGGAFYAGRRLLGSRRRVDRQ